MIVPIQFAIEPGGVADPVSVSPRAAHAAAIRAVGLASGGLGRALAAESRVRAALKADGIDVAPLGVDAARVVAVLLEVARATGVAS